MARIFITGSADGLGRAAAENLLGDGHEVIVHARSAERLANVAALIARGASAVVGDFADLDQTRAVADQLNRLGPVDAAIHNAGVHSGRHVLPVNVVAPYLLTALVRATRSGWRATTCCACSPTTSKPTWFAVERGKKQMGKLPRPVFFGDEGSWSGVAMPRMALSRRAEHLRSGWGGTGRSLLLDRGTPLTSV